MAMHVPDKDVPDSPDASAPERSDHSERREHRVDPTLPYADYDTMAGAFNRHVAPGKLRFWEQMHANIVLGRREGIWFEDAYTGKRYINCHSNGGNYNLGHCNPEVSEAVRSALGSLDIGNHHFASPWRARLAERLSATTGDHLSRVVFGVSGGEAIDLAIKTARARTGRSRIVSVLGGYHGHTGLALATGDAEFRDLFGANLPGFEQVAWDDGDAMAEAVDENTAAVILESLPATAGMCIPSPGYFARVREVCDRAGALLILDEVQSGLGRTGRIWGYLHEGIEPDILVTAKGLGGGIYPISATLMTPDVHEPLNQNPFIHISTFGGSELGCVAALAVLNIIEEPGFGERVQELGERFEREFADLPFELRRRGMFMGMKFKNEGDSLMALLRLLAAGVFAFPSGNDKSVLQFLPPMTITDDETTELIASIRQVLAR